MLNVTITPRRGKTANYGFEPQQTESKSAMLPLHQLAFKTGEVGLEPTTF